MNDDDNDHLDNIINDIESEINDIESEINDIESENIISDSEEKSNNRFSSKEAYIGYAIAAIILIYNFLPLGGDTTDQFCNGLLDSWNEFYDLETEIIELRNETIDIMYDYVDVSETDSYLSATSTQQKIIHEEIGLYKLPNIKRNLEIVATSIQEFEYKYDTDKYPDLHSLFLDINSNYAELTNLSISDVSLFIILTEEVELYFEKWDIAYEENNISLMDVLDEKYYAFEEEQFLKSIEIYEQIEPLQKGNLDKINNFENLSMTYCEDIYFEEE